MSGGHFSYSQYRLGDIAETLREDIAHYSKAGENEYGEWDPLPDDVLEGLKLTLDLLAITEQLSQRADWLISGDDGEDSYKERAAEELSQISKSCHSTLGKTIAKQIIKQFTKDKRLKTDSYLGLNIIR